MARDIEADVKVNDKTKPGLDSVEKRFSESGKKITKEYEKFGTGAGNAILSGIGKVAPQFAAQLAGSIGGAASIGAPILIAGIAAAAPVIGGLIGAAVTGGAAGAGIVGGVALAAQDSRVKAAGTQLGVNLLSGLTERAGSFVQPVLASIDVIEAKFLETGDTIERIFQNSSKFVVPLTSAIADATGSLIDGIDVAVGNAGPVMDALNGGIVQLGSSVEMFFGNVSASAEGNAAVLEDVFDAISSIIAIAGPAVQALSEIYGVLDQLGLTSGLLVSLNELFNGTPEAAAAATAEIARTNDVMQRGGLTVEQYEKDLDLVNKALEDNARAAEQAAQAQQSLFSDVTRVGAAMDAAKKSAKENGETLSENTAKGRENREALAGLASAFNTYRSNQEKAGASANVLSGTLASQRTKFIQTAQSMGASSTKARQLANDLLGIPSPKPKVTLNTAGVASQARNAREEIAQIRGKTVTVTVNVNASRLAAVENRLSRLQASGYFGGGHSFADLSSGQNARTGGASPINLTNSLQVSLDGVPFRTYTTRAIETNRDQERFRNKVGRRNP